MPLVLLLPHGGGINKHIVLRFGFPLDLTKKSYFEIKTIVFGHPYFFLHSAFLLDLVSLPWSLQENKRMRSFLYVDLCSQ